jgi:hypothetical protein
MRRLWLLLLLAALSACSRKPIDLPAPLTGQARSLAASWVVPSPEAAALLQEAEDLCAALRSLDEAAYRERCETSPFLLALRSLVPADRPAAAPPSAKPGDTPPSRPPAGVVPPASPPGGPFAGLPDDRRAFLAQEVKRRLEAIEVEVSRHVAQRFWTGKLLALSELDVLFEDIVQATKTAAQAPRDAFELLPEKTLRADLDDLRRLIHLQALNLARMPHRVATEVTLATLRQYETRIDAVLKEGRSDWTSRHRIVDPEAFDATAFEASRATFEARAKVHASQHLQRHRQSLQGLVDPDTGKPHTTGPPSRSSLAFDSLFMQDTAPVRYVESSAALRAEHDAMSREGRLGRPPPDFRTWRLGLLTAADLARALQRRMSSASNPLAGLTPVPDDLLAEVRREIQKRQAGTPPSPATHTAFDEALPHRPVGLAEQAYRVRFASDLYPRGSAAMPPALREVFTSALRAVSDQVTSRLERLSARYFAASDQLVALPDAAEAKVVDDGNGVRKLLREAALGHWQLLLAWEPRHDVDFSAEQAGLARLHALLDSVHRRTGGHPFDAPPPPDAGPPTPDGPDKPPGSPGPQQARPHKSPPALPGTLLVNPVSAMAMARAEDLLSRLEQQVEGPLKAMEAAANRPDIGKASVVNTAMGRRTVDEKSLRGQRDAFSSMAQADDQRRLADGMKEDWDTFRKPGTQGKPGEVYDFATEVRDFKKFDGVGGGIHLGAKAMLPDPGALDGHVLRYDAGRQQLMLVPPSGRPPGSAQEIPLDFPVEAAALKALYRYAKSGHNLAVSIGWTGRVVLRRSAQDPDPVLLDRSFVDTVVGQDLVLADSIPWKLGEPHLPNGARNPGHAALCPQFVAHRSEALALERDVLLRLAKLLARSPLEGAMAVKNLIFLGKPKAPPVRGELLGADTLWQVARELRASSPQPAAEVLDAFRLRTGIAREVVDDDLLVVTLGVYQRLPRITLAALWDKDPTLRVSEGRVHLDGGLAWKYATRHLSVEDEGVRMSNPADPSQQARQLDGLTREANALLDSGRLAGAYPPLARVARYAEVAALLRWAIGRHGAMPIDFSELAGVSSFDTRRTPTPDQVRREPSRIPSSCPD